MRESELRRQFDRLANEALERDGWTCRGCGRPTCNVHADARLGGDPRSYAELEDVVAYCTRCRRRDDPIDKRRAHNSGS